MTNRNQDTMKGMIKQVVDVQKEPDKKFVKSEEKRMKMEEAQQEGRHKCTAIIKNSRCVCLR